MTPTVKKVADLRWKKAVFAYCLSYTMPVYRVVLTTSEGLQISDSARRIRILTVDKYKL